MSNTVHKKIKPYKCKFCEKGFVRNRTMKNHERNVHKKCNVSDVSTKDISDENISNLNEEN